MIDYSYSQGILRVTFKDKINFEEILDYLKKFSELEELPNHLLLLYNFDNADFNLTGSEIKMISHVIEKATEKYDSIKTALLANNPKIKAFATLFSELGDRNKTKRKIFSTKDAALKWLKDF